MNPQNIINFVLRSAISSAVIWVLYDVIILLCILVLSFFGNLPTYFILFGFILAIILFLGILIAVNAVIFSIPVAKLWDENENRSKKVKIVLLAAFFSLLILIFLPKSSLVSIIYGY